MPGASPRLELWAVKVRRHADNSSLLTRFTGRPLDFAQPWEPLLQLQSHQNRFPESTNDLNLSMDVNLR